MKEKNVIDMCDLDFKYGKDKVLDQFSLSLNRGEILGLIGKNGAGKTTAIYLLLGLLTAGKGYIKVLGFDPRYESVKILSRCGFFPEQAEPYKWLRVKDFFKLGEYSYSKWDPSLCRELCEKLELDSHKRISDLSKGMLVKAELIFAMSHKPEILVLDEPTNALDPVCQYDILSFIKTISIQQNITVLISSHNLDLIAEIASRICIIDKGKNLFSSNMEAILTKFALVEYLSETTLSQDLSRYVLHTRLYNGITCSLLADKTDYEVIKLIKKNIKNVINFKNINLKELFLFLVPNEK